MKGQKLFTIDTELLQKLQHEPNQSLLISNLLIKHYQQNLSSEELDTQEAQLKELIEDSKNKLKMITQRRAKLERDKNDILKDVVYS